MVSRDDGLKLVERKVGNRNLIKHMLATEAIMKALAVKFNSDIDAWGLAGLVHDVDYKKTEKKPEEHGLIGAKWLEELGYPTDVIKAVSCHNEMTGVPIESTMDKALHVCDPLTGLIVACALIHPDKKLSSIDVPFILNRFKERRFAAGASREQMERCTEIGLTLEEFVEIGLVAMRGISDELGL